MSDDDRYEVRFRGLRAAEVLTTHRTRTRAQLRRLFTNLPLASTYVHDTHDGEHAHHVTRRSGVSSDVSA